MIEVFAFVGCDTRCECICEGVKRWRRRVILMKFRVFFESDQVLIQRVYCSVIKIMTSNDNLNCAEKYLL